MNKLIFNGMEYDLIETGTDTFYLHAEKDELDDTVFFKNPMPAVNPMGLYVAKCLRIGDKYYAFKPIKPYNYSNMTVEKWNYIHSNDPIPKFLGIDGTYIPERYIPYNTDVLRDNDVIISEDEHYLKYVKDAKSFVLLQEKDKQFLPNPFKKWFYHGL